MDRIEKLLKEKVIQMELFTDQMCEIEDAQINEEEDKEILHQQILTAKRKAKRDEAIAEWQNQEAS